LVELKQYGSAIGDTARAAILERTTAMMGEFGERNPPSKWYRQAELEMQGKIAEEFGHPVIITVTAACADYCTGLVRFNGQAGRIGGDRELIRIQFRDGTWSADERLNFSYSDVARSIE